jgi:hypothetical protein
MNTYAITICHGESYLPYDWPHRTFYVKAKNIVEAQLRLLRHIYNLCGTSFFVRCAKLEGING